MLTRTDHRSRVRISNRRTTDPAVEPVTVDQLDKHLRGDGVLASEDGDFLTSLIQSAREYVEEFTRRALITQSYTVVMDTWPPTQGGALGWWDGVREGSIVMDQQNYLELPIAPLQSVTSVTTFDDDNSATVFDSNSYFLDTISQPGQLILNTGTVWPVFTRTRRGIEIVYVAGYGNAATDVPAALRQAILQLASHWYENRETVKPGVTEEPSLTPLHIQSILNRYKVQRL